MKIAHSQVLEAGNSPLHMCQAEPALLHTLWNEELPLLSPSSAASTSSLMMCIAADTSHISASLSVLVKLLMDFISIYAYHAGLPLLVMKISALLSCNCSWKLADARPHIQYRGSSSELRDFVDGCCLIRFGASHDPIRIILNRVRTKNSSRLLAERD